MKSKMKREGLKIRERTWSNKMGYIILGAGLLYALFILSLMMSERKHQYNEKAQNVVVLGAQVRGDPAYPSSVLVERLDAAIEYVSTSPDAKIIVCGGQGADETATEASVMASYLMAHGVESNRIVEENLSTSTKENLIHAKPMLLEGKTVIVSSDYHIYRAKMHAKRLGIENIESYAAESKTKVKLKNYIREVFALGRDFIFSW